MKKKTESQHEDLQKHVDELKNKYLRALADYQNLERRTQQEKAQVRRYAAEMVIQKLLPVVDTFRKAREHINDTGLDLAVKDLEAVLTEHGVERIPTVGTLFNPHEMECVEVVEGEDSKVIEETSSGYRIGEKILRVAKVKVGQKKSKSTDAQSTN